MAPDQSTSRAPHSSGLSPCAAGFPTHQKFSRRFHDMFPILHICMLLVKSGRIQKRAVVINNAVTVLERLRWKHFYICIKLADQSLSNRHESFQSVQPVVSGYQSFENILSTSSTTAKSKAPSSLPTVMHHWICKTKNVRCALNLSCQWQITWFIWQFRYFSRTGSFRIWQHHFCRILRILVSINVRLSVPQLAQGHVHQFCRQFPETWSINLHLEKLWIPWRHH